MPRSGGKSLMSLESEGVRTIIALEVKPLCGPGGNRGACLESPAVQIVEVGQ